ncbi:LOW QUALITY PROTEIN: cytochrome P450 [Colletotrichum cereale]|nr:LOW QUALITY PROTEIN: cytochrome P450 [Colletotrichum cereale]
MHSGLAGLCVNIDHLFISVVYKDVRLWTVVAILAAAQLLRPKKTAFPVVNKYQGDFLNRRTYREVRENCRKLITEGLAKHQGGPITIAIPDNQKIVLQASLAGWVKANKDLDHREVVKHDYFAGLPGFEAQAVLHGDDETPKRVIKTKLGQSDSTMATMNASLARAFELIWGDSASWHAVNWYQDTAGIIARAASSVFVGPEKAGDAEWLELVQGYVMSYCMAVGELHAYPAWARFIFLPNATNCRKLVPRARAIMNEVVQAASGDGSIKMGDLQLSLAMAALFTTSEMFRLILINLARHPDLAEPLRKEVSEQISTHGVSLVSLDSVMKESQRLGSGLVVLERVALKDTALPDGRIVPRGSHIMVDSTGLWDAAAYPNPDQFDGYRFLRKRETVDTSSQFIQSGPDYHVFGGGRHICPGRFFAGNELNIALAHILLKYDIRLAEGCDLKTIISSHYAMVDPTVQLEVRRRTDGAAAGVLL